jgi:hypothetical protein
VWKLDDANLADSALDLHLCDAEDSIIMLASVGGVDAHIPDVFEAKTFKDVDR